MTVRLFEHPKSLLTLLLLLTSSFNAIGEEQTGRENFLQIGVEGVYYSGLYNGLDGYTEVDLALDGRLGPLFAEGQTLGLDIVSSERASLAIAVTRGKDFLEVDEINEEQQDLYLGIEDRDRATEFGVIYRYNSRVGIFTMSMFKDFFDAHDAHRGVIKFARPITDNEVIQVTPSIFVNYYSEKYNDYYYGVSREENDAGILLRSGIVNSTTRAQFETLREEYSPGNSGHFGFDVDISYALARGLALTLYGSYEEITGPQYRSPLVEDRKYYTARLGLAYTF